MTRGEDRSKFMALYLAAQPSVRGVEGDLVRLRFEGASLAEERTPEAVRGFDARILGRASWNSKRERFVSFEMLAAGPRWGGKGPAPTSVRSDDTGPNPLGVAFRLAPSTEGPDRVPPTFLLHPLGEKYFQ